MTINHIRPPFSDYHRANLERLVKEGFERIEAGYAAAPLHWDKPLYPVMPVADFQLLCAADFYLRSTGGRGNG